MAMKLTIIFALSIVVGLSGCASTGDGSSEVSAKAIDTSNIETMASKKDIYIGHLGVTFVTQDKSSSKSTGPMSRHSSGTEYAKAVLTAKLSGVPQAVMQDITDQAYVSLVSSLEARGYNVRDYSELKKNKQWAKIKPLKTPFTPNSVGSFFKGEKRTMTSYAPTDMGLITSADLLDTYNLSVIADDTKIPVLAVNYTVHFAYFDKESDYSINYVDIVPTNGGTSKTLTASVAIGQGIQVTSGSGMVFLVDQGGTFSDNGYAKLEDPVIVLGAYGENEDTTSGMQEAANTFSAVLGVFSGGSTESKEVSITANSAYYQFGVLKAIDEANIRLSNAMPKQN